MHKHVRAAAVQTGPLKFDIQRNHDYNLAQIEEAARSDVDYILLPELCTTPFFCVGLHDKSFFKWAESIPGPTTDLYSERSKEFGMTIVLPMFEKGKIEGEYFDSAVVISNGEIVEGTLSNGRQVKCARKNYISHEALGGSLYNDEKYYFKPGPGDPIFVSTKAKIGILICYDRWVPEAWRVLALQGAEIIFVPYASSGKVRDSAICLLRANAAMNGLFCISANKVGVEEVKHKTTEYYGLSCIVDPRGKVLNQASSKSPKILTTTLEARAIFDARTDIFSFRDRRADLYEVISRL